MEAAISYHSAGRLDQAVSLYLEAAELDPENADVLHLLGVVAYQRGQLVEAADLIGRAIARDPRDASYHSNLGNVQKAAGSWGAAVSSYRQALLLAPDFLDAHNNLGALLETMGRHEEASAAFREVIARNPRSAAAHNNLGTVLKSLGRLDEAVASYRRALELEPGYTDVHHNLGNLWLKSDRPEEAVLAFEHALGVPLSPVREVSDKAQGSAVLDASGTDGRPLDPRAAGESCLGLALALERLDRLEEAVTRCRDAVRYRPDHAESHHRLGILLQKVGRFDAAVVAYRESLRVDPSAVECMYNLATVYQRSGRLDEALDGYRAVLAADPTFTRAYRALGKLLYGLGDSRGALAVYETWVSVDPLDPEATHLVAACSGGAAPDRASSDYVRAHFNEFARDFDRQLLGLGYCGPELVVQSLVPYRPAMERSWDVLDAGCGTGLSGVPLRPWARRLVGVDLAEKMLEQASAREIYDELVAFDLEGYLPDHRSEFDLVVAADTVVYFGRVDRLFSLVAGSLRENGLFVFTAEDAGQGESSGSGQNNESSETSTTSKSSATGTTSESNDSGATESASPGFVLNPGGRFAHSAGYLLHCLRGAGLEPVDVRRAFLRSEMDRPVDVWVVVARAGQGVW